MRARLARLVRFLGLDTALGVALLVMALCAWCNAGCTAADQQKAHGAFVDVLGVLKWACRGVGAVDSIHESVSPTSGGDDGAEEEPHTIDGEDP